jgi:hypothetical protein
MPFQHHARDSHQGPGKDSVARGAPKGWTLEKNHRTCQGDSSGIRDRDLKEQVRLGSERAFNKTVRKTIGLEVMK